MQGTLVPFLAQRAADAMWRLRRCMSAEADLLDEYRCGFDGEDEGLGKAFESDSRRGAHSLARLSTYETALERSLHRSLRTLTLLQAARGANALHVPWDDHRAGAALGMPRPAGAIPNSAAHSASPTP